MPTSSQGLAPSRDRIMSSSSKLNRKPLTRLSSDTNGTSVSSSKLKPAPLKKKPSETKGIHVKSKKKKSASNTRRIASSTVLKQHGYSILELIKEKKDVNVYHVKREKCTKLYKIEEYMNNSHSSASLNCQWLKHENLLPYLDHFQNVGRYYFVADITRPNAFKYMEKKCQSSVQKREELARKWTGQLVKVIKYCHRAALYLTDFEWSNTIIKSDNLVLTAFDGMTDTTNSVCLQLGPNWNQPPELLRAGGCLHLSVPKIETWVVGCAILELLIGHHLGKALEESSQQDAITQAQAWFNIKSNLLLLPFWLEGSSLSGTAKEFVCWILNENSHQRPSIEDVSYHSWIADISAAKEDPYDPDLLSIMQAPIRKRENYSAAENTNQCNNLSCQLFRKSRDSQSTLSTLQTTRPILTDNHANEVVTENLCDNNVQRGKDDLPPYIGTIFAAIILFVMLYIMTGFLI